MRVTAVFTAECVFGKVATKTWRLVRDRRDLEHGFSDKTDDTLSRNDQPCKVSHPAKNLRSRRRVLTIVPSARTTVMDTTHSCIVPCRYALVPDQFIAINLLSSSKTLRHGREGIIVSAPSKQSSYQDLDLEGKSDRGLLCDFSVLRTQRQAGRRQSYLPDGLPNFGSFG